MQKAIFQISHSLLKYHSETRLKGKSYYNTQKEDATPSQTKADYFNETFPSCLPCTRRFYHFSAPNNASEAF